MNFIPSNTWELNMAEWRCYLSEMEYKKAKEAELNSEEAIERLIDSFTLEEEVWPPESRLKQR